MSSVLGLLIPPLCRADCPFSSPELCHNGVVGQFEIDLAGWLGSLGRLGWLVIGANHPAILSSAKLYFAGPSVKSIGYAYACG